VRTRRPVAHVTGEPVQHLDRGGAGHLLGGGTRVEESTADRREVVHSSAVWHHMTSVTGGT